METISKIDKEIFLYLNRFVGESDLLDRVSAFLVNDYFVPVLSSMILLSIWFGWKTEEQMLSRFQDLIRNSWVRNTGLGVMRIFAASLTFAVHGKSKEVNDG